MVKLHQMAVLVSQASDITERELKFIGAYPLGSLLETEAGGLLEEAKQIMDNLVNKFLSCVCVFWVGGGGVCA
jgi:hypothetical protein